ncbi:MAG: translation initiation factor IF-2 subunit gamma [Palaeococcus sp.]|uniref:translation initiation factor IF-2 subunit gamma n=1 Tax=Palaeococcus sp. (in: euryarchaeotes) TaxID=2820298 RepID=UPI0025EEA1EB|nr:translation initiation factor IF-2 subunit gamma [Palaeococcus sp. (in: euryarchaeotes)]MCD6558853.1 translation initiation factor IF-2 subunit gamma [Palaeococcus sp. (in: euryarchaeotes)]
MAKKKFKQAEVNIGMVGHVDHGKTTLTKALTGIWADTHSEELRRGITIKIGFADAEIRKCPSCGKYSTSPKCPYCGAETEFERRVSFIDAPGHEALMTTMLAGASLMDGAILVIAANEPCPKPQTREHLMALQIVGNRNIIIAQNKIELVDKERALENYREIKEFVKGTVAENAPIIPISALHGANVDVLMKAIEEVIPTRKRNPRKSPRMLVLRSFDVNKPGTTPERLIGGVLGGSIIQGKLKVGDEIEIRPGIPYEEHGRIRYEPITTEIVSLQAGGKFVDEAFPGGLVGVGTKLDPYLTKGDLMAGNVVGKPGKLPPVWNELRLDVHLLDRVVGTEEELKVEPIKRREMLLLNVGTARTVGLVTNLGKDEVEIKLQIPICAEPGDRVAISRQVGSRWRLIGYGLIKG